MEPTDTTDRKEMEELFRLQDAALQAAANAIVITSVDGTIRWVNRAFSALTGYCVDEAIGKTPGELIRSGEQGREFYCNLWNTILAGDVWHGELVNRRKNGSLYCEEQSISPVRDARGTITHFIAIKQDITERRHMASRLAYQA
ncbi:PAS domain S-box protein, partial [Aquisalimonas sp.]|uniref:PAS domain-containing protein n=1 Tax=Aquisalimonas sp. TaxID=1872621 RepID=UPI0025C080A5